MIGIIQPDAYEFAGHRNTRPEPLWAGHERQLRRIDRTKPIETGAIERLNDVSERAFQMQSTQWDKGKGCDSFGPIGPWLVMPEELGDVHDLRLWLDVNGQRFQDGSTSTMIFRPAFILSYLSRYMSLQPGDIVTTGRPPGVGLGQVPQKWLDAGDVVSLGIEGLGDQRQLVVQV